MQSIETSRKKKSRILISKFSLKKCFVYFEFCNARSENIVPTREPKNGKIPFTDVHSPKIECRLNTQHRTVVSYQTTYTQRAYARGRMEKRTRKWNEWSLLCVIMWLGWCVVCCIGKRVHDEEANREIHLFSLVSSSSFCFCFLVRTFTWLKAHR